MLSPEQIGHFRLHDGYCLCSTVICRVARQGAVSFRTIGSVDLVHGGSTNRSGVGASVHFTPENLPTAMIPIIAGSSFTSQHALDAHFGMGQARRGTVDVLWPSGVRNRLHNVRPGERIVLPEIPCSIDDDRRFWRYAHCVGKSLRQLRREKVISRAEARRLRHSALYAFYED